MAAQTIENLRARRDAVVKSHVVKSHIEAETVQRDATAALATFHHPRYEAPAMGAVVDGGDAVHGLLPLVRRGLAVGLAAIPNADDLNGFRAYSAEDDGPCADPEAVLRRIETLQLADVAGLGFKQAAQLLSNRNTVSRSIARISARAWPEKITRCAIPNSGPVLAPRPFCESRPS